MRKHGKSREKRNQFRYWEFGRILCPRRDTDALFGTTEAGTSKREQGQRRMGSAREDELGKVRYKPGELGLYIDDPEHRRSRN